MISAMMGLRQIVARIVRPPAPGTAAAIVLIAAALPLAIVPAARAADAQVIVNQDHAQVPLDRDLLWSIFTMHLREWPGGAPIHVFVLPDNATLSDEFYREKLGTYSYILRSLWDRMVFTGTGFAPTVVPSEQEMRRRVRGTPGAIGYVGGGSGWYGRLFDFGMAWRPAPPAAPSS